jgi:Domain of unknown function (DUF4476)
MKSIYISLFLLFGFLATSVQGQSFCATYLTTRANEAFVVSINGRLINAEPVRDLFIMSMPSGKFNIEYTIFRPSVAPTSFISDITISPAVENQYEFLQEGNSVILSGIGTPGMGQTPHGLHATYTIKVGTGGNFSTGQYTVTQSPNGYNSQTEKWNEISGWPGFVNPTPDPNPVFTGGDTTCPLPMTYDGFNAAMTRIKSKPLEGTRLAIAKDIAEQNCFSSLQVKEMLSIFSVDNSRVELGKIVWHHLNDPKNWSLVYDAFTYGDKIEELKAYVKSHPLSTPKVFIAPPPPKDTQIVIVPHVYVPPPVAVAGYTGPIGCAWPMDDATFNSMKASVNAKSFADEKEAVVRQAVGASCVTAAQSKKIVELFTFDSGKIEMAQFCWDHCYDYDNFFMVNDAFTFSSSMDEVNDYMEKHPRTPYDPNQIQKSTFGCASPMSSQTFTALKSSIGKQIGSSSKMTIAKQGLKNACVTVAQVKELMTIFSFDSDKLEIAKYCWTRCYDYTSYFIVNDAITSSFSSEELDAYMKANPR